MLVRRKESGPHRWRRWELRDPARLWNEIGTSVVARRVVSYLHHQFQAISSTLTLGVHSFCGCVVWCGLREWLHRAPVVTVYSLVMVESSNLQKKAFRVVDGGCVEMTHLLFHVLFVAVGPIANTFVFAVFNFFSCHDDCVNTLLPYHAPKVFDCFFESALRTDVHFSV